MKKYKMNDYDKCCERKYEVGFFLFCCLSNVDDDVNESLN